MSPEYTWIYHHNIIAFACETTIALFTMVQSKYAQKESELLSSIPIKQISSSRYIPIIKDNKK